MERIYQSESIKELATALAKAQGEFANAKKDQDNPFFKSKYADMAGVYDASRAALAKHGLAVTQMPDVADDGKVTLITQVIHSSGEWIRSWYPVTPVKSDPQSLGAAMTYARRYAYSSVTGVAVEDDDGNAASGHGEAKPEAEKAASDIFKTDEDRRMFVATFLSAIESAHTKADLKDRKEIDKAKLDAIKDSKCPADMEAWKKILASFNDKFEALKQKEAQMLPSKPATVDAAKALGGDEIPY